MNSNTNTQNDYIKELKNILECLFFVSNEPLSQDKLSELSGYEKGLIGLVLTELEQEYAGRGFLLRQVAGGWQFCTDAAYVSYIEKLYRPRKEQLSRAKLETLAIIAYKQPLTRQDIENIRQVNADGIVSSLLEKNLIKEVGRRDTPGKPILYGTTQDFLRFFGLQSLNDLPALEHFETTSGSEMPLSASDFGETDC